MTDLPATPAATLSRAREIGLKAGLHYVYTGNIHDSVGDTTLCPACRAKVIVRDWYEILDYRLSDDGDCCICGHLLAGRFAPFHQAFGARRIPVRV